MRVEKPDLIDRPDAARPEKVEAVHRILENDEARIVYQPIVELRSRKIFAYEALTRIADPLFLSPLDLFESSVYAGRVAELGRYSRQQAVIGCNNFPLFLNIFPSEFDYGWLVRPDDPIFLHPKPVYLEVTESVPLSYFEQCHSVLAELRKKGTFVAVDDLGAGYSNLKYIADLEPDVVKIDRELVAGIRVGDRHFRLLKSIVDLCKEMEARVVAEGIETIEELAAVRAAGADFAQGYLFARPEFPPPPVIWPDNG